VMESFGPRVPPPLKYACPMMGTEKQEKPERSGKRSGNGARKMGERGKFRGIVPREETGKNGGGG